MAMILMQCLDELYRYVEKRTQRQLPFQMHVGQLLKRNHVKRWSAARHLKDVYTYRNAPPPQKVQSSLGIMDYLSLYFSVGSEVCQPLRICMSVRTEWTWNQSKDVLYNIAKSTMKIGPCLRFYNEKESLYLETEASGVNQGAGLLQVREGINCPQDKELNSMILCPMFFAKKLYQVQK